MAAFQIGYRVDGANAICCGFLGSRSHAHRIGAAVEKGDNSV